MTQQILRCHLPERIARGKSKVSAVDAYVFAIHCFFRWAHVVTEPNRERAR